MPAPERRPSDFMIMVAVVIASMVIEAVLLVVVPRAEPAAPASAAPSAHTIPTVSTFPSVPTPPPTTRPPVVPRSRGNLCPTDGDLQDRLAPPDPADAFVEEQRWDIPAALTTKYLWEEGGYGLDTGIFEHLTEAGLEGCASVRWYPDNSRSVAIVVLRFPDAMRARGVAEFAAADLLGRPIVGRGTFDFPDSSWVRVEFSPQYHEYTGLLLRGAYLAFVRAHPIGNAIDWELFVRVATEQWNRLG